MMGGFAVLLMMCHHLYNFPYWLDDGVRWETSLGYFGKASAELVGVFGSICVQVFALMSGYALMTNPASYGTWRKRISRLMKFLLAYWTVNILFLIIGFINNDTMPGIEDLLFNLIGLRTGPTLAWVNVPFAWYVCYYIEFIFLTPLLIWGFGSSKKILDITMSIAMMLLVFIARQTPCIAAVYLSPLLSTVLGIIIAKYSIFNKLQRNVTGRLHWTLLISAIILVIIFRYEVGKLNPNGGVNWGFFMQIFLAIVAAALILFSVEVFHRIRSRHFKNSLMLLGSLSMYLWFLHGIFFTGKNFMQPIIFAAKEPILILIVCTIVLLPVAWLLRCFQCFLEKKIFTP